LYKHIAQDITPQDYASYSCSAPVPLLIVLRTAVCNIKTQNADTSRPTLHARQVQYIPRLLHVIGASSSQETD